MLKKTGNVQKDLHALLLNMQEEGVVKRLLLHSCCAPCSSYCLEYLSDYFQITVLYFNPNITEKEEYQYRIEEQRRLIYHMSTKYPIDFLEGNYLPQEFFALAKGLEDEKEGGERCTKCYELRLRETGKIAKQNNFDFFTTTLTISPHKKASLLNEIGMKIGEEFGIPYLCSDFKKNSGFLRSTQLSKEYDLYRQDYCGCVFSKRDWLQRK